MIQTVEEMADGIKDQLLEEASSVLKQITDGDKEFFAELAQRYARNFWQARTGTDEEKEIAKENIEALNRASGSKIAERGLDFVEGGEKVLVGVLKTIGKTLLTVALAAV
jgi:hypothetical protein